MKRMSLGMLALAVGLVACNEIATSPQAAADRSVRLGFSNPPPPDVDTGAYGGGGGTTFELRVRYFFNKTGNAGWMKFDSEAGDVSVDKNAQIRYSNGVFSGKGIVEVSGLTLDLSRVSQTSQFSSCEAWTAPTAADVSTEDTAPVGCFNVIIGGASVEDPNIYLTESCATGDAYDPRAVCRGRTVDGGS